MQIQLIITATTKHEATILATHAAFLADLMEGTEVTVTPSKAGALLEGKALKSPEAPKHKGPGRPRKEAAVPVVASELVEDDDDDIGMGLEDDDDLGMDLDDADDDDAAVEVEEDEPAAIEAPKKAKAEKAPAAKKYSQKDIINAFKDFANKKGRDAGVALLKKYSVKSSREIKESDFPEFMKILTK